MAELLAGVGGEVEARLWQTLSSLPDAELRAPAWREIGAVARSLRKSGRSLPLTDLAIAIAAAHAGYVLWSFDSDFERICGAVQGLELYEPA